jgi:hypothetical protein
MKIRVSQRNPQKLPRKKKWISRETASCIEFCSGAQSFEKSGRLECLFMWIV